MKLPNTPEKWLLTVAGSYAVVFIGYGHAGLPLAIAVPFVWGNWREADRAIAAVAATGAVGIGALSG